MNVIVEHKSGVFFEAKAHPTDRWNVCLPCKGTGRESVSLGSLWNDGFMVTRFYACPHCYGRAAWQAS